MIGRLAGCGESDYPGGPVVQCPPAGARVALKEAVAEAASFAGLGALVGLVVSKSPARGAVAGLGLLAATRFFAAGAGRA